MESPEIHKVSTPNLWQSRLHNGGRKISLTKGIEKTVGQHVKK